METISYGRLGEIFSVTKDSLQSLLFLLRYGGIFEEMDIVNVSAGECGYAVSKPRDKALSESHG